MRLLGPDLARRTVTQVVGSSVYDFSGRVATVYLDEALTQLAPIAAYNAGTPTTPGATIANSQITLSARNSRLPLFFFPEGVDTLWVSVNGLSHPWTITADLDNRFDTGDTIGAGLFAQTHLPRFQPGTLVSQLQAGHGWTGSTGFTANDTTDFTIGSQSAKILTPGDGGTYKIEKTGLSLDTTGKQIRLRLKIDGLARINTWRFLAGNDTGYAASYSWDLALGGEGNTNYFVDGEWVTITLNFASATATGTPTRSGIVAIKVNTRDDSTGTGVTAHLQSVELVAEPTTTFPNGVVSIGFDDNWDSVWTLAKPKLDAVGFRATVHSIGDLVGLPGRLTSAQHLVMQQQGWEIAAHCQYNANHTSTLTALTEAAVEADMRAQVADMRSKGLRVQGTAYPQGAYGATSGGGSTLNPTRRYFSYARTVYRRTVETFPPADLMRLRAQSGISTFSGGYAPALLTTTTTGDIDRAKTNRAWLHLVFHKIVTTTPAATSEVTQTDFNTIVDKIVSSGMACLPIADVLAYDT